MTTTSALAFLSGKFAFISKSLASLREKRIVGKPQVISRLRYVRVLQHQDETPQERRYRLRYDSLQDWNNKYWAENNELFDREKNAYIRSNFGESISKEEALSHDQLAPFYRSFLEKNRVKHMRYNKLWYRNHASLLYISFIAKVSRFRETIAPGKRS